MLRMITVHSPKEWKQFLAVQGKVYDVPSAASPLPEFEVRRLLDARKNPAFRERTLLPLLALENGDPVGRCSLLLPGNGNDRTAVFGFFECIDDQSVAKALLGHAGEVSLQHGATAIYGPFSPTRSGVTGIQLDCFGEKNVLYEACSPPYYAQLLESAGYTIERRGRTWRNLSLRRTADGLVADLPDRSSRYHIRQVGLRDLRSGIQDLSTTFELAFGDGWGRAPVSLDEYFYYAAYLLPAFRPESLNLVYDGARPVGAFLCFPDVNPAFNRAGRIGRTLSMLNARWYAPRSRTLVTFAMGIHPEHRNSAVSLLLARRIAEIARHYDDMYSTWITEGNTASERMAARFGLAPWKTFAVYRKDL